MTQLHPLLHISFYAGVRIATARYARTRHSMQNGDILLKFFRMAIVATCVLVIESHRH